MKHALALLAGLAAASPAFAQTAPAAGSPPAPALAAPPARRPAPDQRGERRAQYLAKELGLSADQQARVEKLLLARQQESAALKSKYGADKKAGRPTMKAAHDRYQTGLKSILTAEQYAKFDQLKDEHRNHGKGKDAKVKTKLKA